MKRKQCRDDTHAFRETKPIFRARVWSRWHVFPIPPMIEIQVLGSTQIAGKVGEQSFFPPLLALNLHDPYARPSVGSAVAASVRRLSAQRRFKSLQKRSN